MKTSQVGIDLIRKYEGLRLKAYKCPAGVWTIGYGHTNGVKEGDVITEPEAIDLLKSDVSKFEKRVEKYDNIYRWNQNEFDALVSFAFNIGGIDQLVGKGRRTRKQIIDKIPQYNKAGGKELAGLTKRRMEEKALFETPVSGISFKSYIEIANEVLSGEWGNGQERKDSLIKAGYDYKRVQREVNKLVANRGK